MEILTSVAIIVYLILSIGWILTQIYKFIQWKRRVNK
jgi:hypothetical protein